jgi:pimeloyl-ACP methyl ester carboxylesterase
MSSVSEPIVASALAIAQVYALDADAGHVLAPPSGYRFAEIAWKGAGDGGGLRCREAPFDGMFPPRFPPALRGAEGFEEVYRSMHDALHAIVSNTRPARLHLAGHSLGAVLATYLCADLLLGAQADAPPITLTLWAPPKPGNLSFADVLRTQRDSGRVTANVLANVHDIVPKYPFSTDYVHPFTPSLLDFGNPFDVLGNHHLAHYLRAYEQGWAHRAPVASLRHEELAT